MFTRSRRHAPAVLACSFFLAMGAATPAFALDPLLPPSGNFELQNWKLTLPSASEVMPWVLDNGYELKDTFYTHTTSGGMVFRTPNIANSTANSNYPRTELREMLAPHESASSNVNNWTPEKGGRLKARLKVDRVSTTGESGKVGRVIVGQIHGPDTEPARLYFHKLPGEAKGRLYLATETFGGSNSYSTDIVSNKDGDGIALGELFTYTITMKGTRVQVDIVRKQGTLVNTYIKFVDSNYLGENMYFKAGVYNQNNTGSTSDYAQATFYSLVATH
ncbi:MAG TPA: polysaccharide lyase family 7 protein [Verrucomicrobiae bacterium]|nr:polysaccharide lyase family 7 protein [Verrucomicrobiae bacterium]